MWADREGGTFRSVSFSGKVQTISKKVPFYLDLKAGEGFFLSQATPIKSDPRPWIGNLKAKLFSQRFNISADGDFILTGNPNLLPITVYSEIPEFIVQPLTLGGYFITGDLSELNIFAPLNNRSTRLKEDDWNGHFLMNGKLAFTGFTHENDLTIHVTHIPLHPITSDGPGKQFLDFIKNPPPFEEIVTRRENGKNILIYARFDQLGYGFFEGYEGPDQTNRSFLGYPSQFLRVYPCDSNNESRFPINDSFLAKRIPFAKGP